MDKLNAVTPIKIARLYAELNPEFSGQISISSLVKDSRQRIKIRDSTAFAKEGEAASYKKKRNKFEVPAYERRGRKHVEFYLSWNGKCPVCRQVILDRTIRRVYKDEPRFGEHPTEEEYRRNYKYKGGLKAENLKRFKFGKWSSFEICQDCIDSDSSYIAPTSSIEATEKPGLFVNPDYLGSDVRLFIPEKEDGFSWFTPYPCFNGLEADYTPDLWIYLAGRTVEEALKTASKANPKHRTKENSEKGAHPQVHNLDTKKNA